MHKLIFIMIVCLILAPAAYAARVDYRQIPPESLDALQTMFSEVRDGLWEKTDYFFHEGEYNRSIAVMRLIVEIDPQDVEAYDDAAWLMQNDFHDNEAEAFLMKGIRNIPDKYDLYFDLGYFYYMHTEFDKAIPYLEVAAAFDCPFFARNQLAHAYEHAGYPEVALGIWLENEYSEPDYGVNTNQVKRILQGQPFEQTAELINKWRQERKQREGL